MIRKGLKGTDMNWTREQERAITLRNKNILVAAAAGSGKTAVLVERIKQLILKDGCDIDRMLIVTFTNAAASEMKEKIEAAIHKEIAENPQAAPELKRQLDLLPSANISTFHAFALEVIRRYFYIIDIEPNFKICDNIQQELLKEHALDELFEKYYAEASPEFFAFLNKYSGDRNDNRLRQTVRKTFELIQSLPEPYPWLENAVSELDVNFDEFSRGKTVRFIMEDAVCRLRKGMDALSDVEETVAREEHEGFCEIVGMYIARAAELLETAEEGNFDKLKAVLENTGRMPTLSKKYFKADIQHTQNSVDEFKEKLELARMPLKEAIDSLKKDYFYDSLENLHGEIQATYADGKFFLQMMKEYRGIFSSLKSAKGVVDFSDIEHFTFEIFKDEEAAGYYREKFSYIFIDEYQDSNILQEALIAKIKRDNNLFMVGDIKQSIYKFRLAEPEIFQGKYRDYAKQAELAEEKGEDSLSEKIDLNRNFRSKKSIIDFINRIFFKIMPNYDENAALYMGDSFGDKCNFSPKLFLTELPWDANEELDDELKNMIKAEKEALSAVKIIKESLGKTIFDSKRGIERPLQKRDIVILLRGIKNYGDIFYKILTDNNLPAFVDDNDGYFDTMEINVFMSLLAVIDNEKQDVPLMTVMRSEIFAFTISEMTEIRIAADMQEENAESAADSQAAERHSSRHNTCSYHEAFVRYAKNGREENLRAKCAEVLQKLDFWRKTARILPLEELVWQLMLDTGFYIAMGAMPAGSQRQANLRALADKALVYRKSQAASLYGFMQYIEAVKQHKVSMGQVKTVSEGDDTIRIMTIHKSKGLEFPMVLLAGYCRRLNYTKASKDIAVHKDIGIGFPLVNYEESRMKTGIIQNTIHAKLRQEEVEEEKRILYVAMTRAKDILYILGITDERDKVLEKVLSSSANDSSYFGMSGRVICEEAGRYEFIQNEDLKNLSQGVKRNVDSVLKMLDAETTNKSIFDMCKLSKNDSSALKQEEIDRRMSFTYPYAEELSIKSKYAVSELNSQAVTSFDSQCLGKGIAVEEIALTEPKSFKLHKGFTSAQIGTLTHKVLEKLDFAAAFELAETYDTVGGIDSNKNKETETYIKQLIEEMVCDEFLTEEEATAVDVGKLAGFVLSPLGMRMAAAQCTKSGIGLVREKPFNLVCEVGGVQSIVQGSIDCFFEEAGELVLIDYKTTRIRTAAELAARRSEIQERYRTQIDLYRKALTAATGKHVKEAYLYLTNIGESIEM